VTRLTANLLLAATLLIPALSAADSIRLREQATVGGSVVTLADIAELGGEAATALAGLQVGQMQPHQTLTLTIEQLREALTQQKVNWGRLTLGGYTRCTIRREAAAAAPAPVVAIAPVAANPTQEVTLQQAQTLRQQLVSHLAALHNVDPESLVVDFEDADAAVLAQVTLGERLEFQPAGDLGRVIIVVRRWRGQDLVATYRLTVQVARKATAVVLRQAITRGQTFTDQHVSLAPVLLKDGREMPVQTLDSVIGLIADASLRPGAVVYPRMVKSPLLVQRNELVTVRALAGGLVITTTARALQDGCAGDAVQVRNERSREVYNVKVTGLRQATLLVSPEPAAAAPAAAEGGAS
jgi:flagella basal body P-ring formation protein FlgA